MLTGIPGKTGLVYTLDRETGEFLWARETVAQNVVAEINTESGAATVDPEKLYTRAGQEFLICPGTLSLISTGGGLLFGGDVNGRFRAYDQRDGTVLWEVNLGSPVNGYPATYEVDGRQYVAVSTGGSGLAFGLVRLTPELHPGADNQLFVFALPE